MLVRAAWMRVLAVPKGKRVYWPMTLLADRRVE